MAIGLVGRKCGMSRVFTEEGASIPVSVIEVEPNRITQIKTVENDGYHAIQVTAGTARANRVTKPMAGHYKKAGIEPGKGLWEFRVDAGESLEGIAVGSEIKVAHFQIGQKVDVTGTTIGKGFAGSVKRHHFSMQDATHGNSLSHRATGSIGMRQTPGRVFKGKKMPGHLGDKQRTIQLLQVIKIDEKRNLLMIKGAIPGARGGYVFVYPSIKAPSKGEKQ